MSDHTITINTNPKWRPEKTILMAFTQTGVIGVGVFTDSAAMQWAGFIVLVIALLGLAGISVKQSRGLSIKAAREYLDTLEAAEARK